MYQVNGFCSGPREVLALLLCVVLFIGCSGVRPDIGSVQFGPSWQEREAIHLQQEGDDLGDRVEEAREEARKKGWRRYQAVMWLFLAAVGVWVFTYDVDDEGEDLTFDSAPVVGEQVGQAPFRYRGAVHY